jgi:hypothetical protein
VRARTCARHQAPGPPWPGGAVTGRLRSAVPTRPSRAPRCRVRGRPR